MPNKIKIYMRKAIHAFKIAFNVALDSSYTEDKPLNVPKEMINELTMSELNKPANKLLREGKLDRKLTHEEAAFLLNDKRLYKKAMGVKYKRRWKAEITECYVFGLSLEYYDGVGMTEGLMLSWFVKDARALRKKSGVTWGPLGYFFNPNLTSLGFWANFFLEISVTVIALALVALLLAFTASWLWLLVSLVLLIAGVYAVIWGLPMYEVWDFEVGDIGPKAKSWKELTDEFLAELHTGSNCPVCSKLKKAPPVSYTDRGVASIHPRWKILDRPSLLKRHPEAASAHRRHVYETVAEFITEEIVKERQKRIKEGRVPAKAYAKAEPNLGLLTETHLEHQLKYDILMDLDEAKIDEYTSDMSLTSENASMRGRHWRKNYIKESLGWHYLFRWELRYPGSLVRDRLFHFGYTCVAGGVVLLVCSVFSTYPSVRWDLVFLSFFISACGVVLGRYYGDIWEGWGRGKYASEVIAALAEEQIEYEPPHEPFPHAKLRIEDTLWQRWCPRCNIDTSNVDVFSLWSVIYAVKYRNDIRRLALKKAKPAADKAVLANPTGVWGEPEWGSWFSNPMGGLILKMYGKESYMLRVNANICREYVWLAYGSLGLTMYRASEKGLIDWARGGSSLAKEDLENRLLGHVTRGAFPAIYWDPYRRTKHDFSLLVLGYEKAWPGRRGRPSLPMRVSPYPYLKNSLLTAEGKAYFGHALLTLGLTEGEFDYANVDFFKPVEAFLWDQYILEAQTEAYEETIQPKEEPRVEAPAKKPVL